MPTITAVSDVRTIALATADRGRTSRFAFLSSYLRDMEVGEAMILEDSELAAYDASIPAIVAKCADGATLSKDDRAKMRNVLSALIREIRKHNESADLHSVYCFNEEEKPAYGVKRVA
jgi:hypothetical protein